MEITAWPGFRLKVRLPIFTLPGVKRRSSQMRSRSP
jgi:hypothetical protein